MRYLNAELLERGYWLLCCAFSSVVCKFVHSYNRVVQSFVETQLAKGKMADQVSVAENIERVSTAGIELARQLHGVSDPGKEVQEEINSFRSQLQSLDMLLASNYDESSDL